MCGAEVESVLHISGFETLLHRHIYTERHNTICKLIHYRLCRKYNIEIVPDNHRNVTPPSIIDNEQAQILYDYPIPTDNNIPCNRPDIVLTDKTNDK